MRCLEEIMAASAPAGTTLTAIARERLAGQFIIEIEPGLYESELDRLEAHEKAAAAKKLNAQESGECQRRTEADEMLVV